MFLLRGKKRGCADFTSVSVGVGDSLDNWKYAVDAAGSRAPPSLLGSARVVSACKQREQNNGGDDLLWRTRFSSAFVLFSKTFCNQFLHLLFPSLDRRVYTFHMSMNNVSTSFYMQNDPTKKLNTLNRGWMGPKRSNRLNELAYKTSKTPSRSKLIAIAPTTVHDLFPTFVFAVLEELIQTKSCALASALSFRTTLRPELRSWNRRTI